ncbi:hypothetical protein CHLRE_13g606962v5 [Chlamydomonas reinhardtii]|uniref:Uncharacterized protein n=1 Tax=Chlamydomonas reinhardtii TaxID=3055 RepID=A8JB04_CHLRE|nr:uncharacterized protein CHLRE_13g606962v5 [Chlamydomonas reinhardtii]XP_042917871.1 uncharacterized protein CHLRE_13g606962v5 [Chlamydomonas reinhardtii]PNW74397.1 hypothetical protein CHLRE_13g606962v5 [Chlamydomonas reinhardtii]PNW74398.1 hypothetical protein CHLRE_13g606962v5 [Chlamydomonas reinhardtii]|eukprot:XP_001699090.1 predicted protein [Chlamydomonas reinhardtii]
MVAWLAASRRAAGLTAAAAAAAYILCPPARSREAAAVAGLRAPSAVHAADVQHRTHSAAARPQ